MSRRRHAWARLVGAAAALLVAGCQPDDAFTLVNHTGVPVVVQLVGGRTPLVAARLAPAGHAVTYLGGLVGPDNCARQEYRALDRTGRVLDRITRACAGQTWLIRAH